MGVRAEILVENNIDAITGDILSAVVLGLNLAGERLLELSLERVPFDQGTLAATGAVERATDPEEGAAVTYDTPYAVRLHEHPEYNFSTKSNPHAQGKWLENAALEAKDELGAIVGAAVKNA